MTISSPHNTSTLSADRVHPTRTSAIVDSATDVAGVAREAANDAIGRLPDMAASTRSAIEDANRQIRSGSDDMLSIGSALSFGLALGLLVGGAARLIVAVALIPAGLMTLTLFDRNGRARRSPTGTQGH